MCKIIVGDKSLLINILYTYTHIYIYIYQDLNLNCFFLGNIKCLKDGLLFLMIEKL